VTQSILLRLNFSVKPDFPYNTKFAVGTATYSEFQRFPECSNIVVLTWRGIVHGIIPGITIAKILFTGSIRNSCDPHFLVFKSNVLWHPGRVFASAATVHQTQGSWLKISTKIYPIIPRRKYTFCYSYPKQIQLWVWRNHKTWRWQDKIWARSVTRPFHNFRLSLKSWRRIRSTWFLFKFIQTKNINLN
jgi:hypothetical protein